MGQADWEILVFALGLVFCDRYFSASDESYLHLWWMNKLA